MSETGEAPDTAPTPALTLVDLAIGHGPAAVLPAVSAIAVPKTPGVVFVETEETPVVASLVAAGRMVAERGRLLLDGVEDRDAVRARSALVDTPGVAEPFPVLTLSQITHEELVFADQPHSSDAVATVLEALRMSDFGHTAIQHVPTHLRVRLLCELALLRDGVDILVVTTPERHGGHRSEWFAELQRIADRGVAVLLITSSAVAAPPRWRAPVQPEAIREQPALEPVPQPSAGPEPHDRILPTRPGAAHTARPDDHGPRPHRNELS